MIGKLDRRVTFIQPVIENGESNEDKVTSWEAIDTDSEVWAAKNEGRGNTFVQADRIVYSKTVTWTIRWRSDLNVRMRLVYGMQVYEILDFTEVNNSRKRYMNVTTTILDNEFWS
jgi:SPP1 family predicted phage head-tail adaptor